MVRVGSIRQDSSIPAMLRVDELLGKHFAILGTTGTGKSCTTALILRSILEKNPAAHVVLLDPHNEYATAFAEWAEVISPRNMHLPYWLLTFEEIVEVLVGDGEHKTEADVLQELIPVAKSRYANNRLGDTAKSRRTFDPARFTVDTPVPYRISDLVSLIDERMGRLENKRDLTPYRNLKHRIETVSQDARYAFMFGSLTVYDGMAKVLGRIFRVPVNNKPITILELTGIPSEIVNVVVSVLCRLTFDFALWSEGQVPVTLVCEEAHRYVPANASLGFEPCKRAIAKIAKEGRKYGASLCIVTQRPAEIDPTILSQCNTVFALRMSNDRDQEIVASAVADTGAGLLEFLPALGQREAIAFGDGMSLPVRIRFDELPRHALPRSSTARFTERWQKSLGDDGFLDRIVERWRMSGIPSGDNSHGLSMMADALGLTGSPNSEPDVTEPALSDSPVERQAAPPRPQNAAPRREVSSQSPGTAPHAPSQSPGNIVPPTAARAPRAAAPASAPKTRSEGPMATAVSLRSLRDRLTRPHG
jgi:DNA helicase HerA-like ATPase